MESPEFQTIKVQLNLRTSDPHMLEKLDALLRLGLIDDTRVRQLCREFLTMPLPDEQRPTEAPAPSSAPLPVPRAPRPPVAPSPISALVEEFSLRWLLFLGVFLVVVSSGVLAATQWERFSAETQYLVLFGYTCLFALASWWGRSKANLRLTAQTLQVVTLSLVPVNFWVMDGFGLWDSVVGWLVVAVASLTLTFIFTALISGKNSSPFSKSAVILSYLHWGWGWPGWAVAAIYSSIIGTSVMAVYRSQTTPREQQKPLWQQPVAIAIAYSLAILLLRAIFVAHVDITLLGLAIGVCGWLLAWLSEEEQQRNPQFRAVGIATASGFCLLFLGWFISIENIAWQAIGVSLLALWLLGIRLVRRFQVADFMAIFIIGLQAYLLVRELIPLSVRTGVATTAVDIAKAADAPYTVYSLTLLPYLILTVWLTDWLYRQSGPENLRPRQCAVVGDRLGLALGTVMMVVGLNNPTVITLNLLASTVILAVITYRRNQLNYHPSLSILVYLTHTVGLLTVFSAINRFFPGLTLLVWGYVAIGLMVVEWGYAIVSNQWTANQREGETQATLSLLWSNSAWYLGLILASFSYALLALVLDNSNSFLGQPATAAECLPWLVTPLFLTLVALTTTGTKRRDISCLSAIALVIANLLLWQTRETLLIGCAIGTGLMLVNTRLWRQVQAAVITFGFALVFAGLLLWEALLAFPSIPVDICFEAIGLAACSLSLTYQRLNHRPQPLAKIYARAATGWALFLSMGMLGLLTLYSFLIRWEWLWLWWGQPAPNPHIIATIILIAIALGYRRWPNIQNLEIYAWGWCLELLAAEFLRFGNNSRISLAIVNIVLALAVQILGDFWDKPGGEKRRAALDSIPLIYGAMGAVFRFGTFTSWTGITTLGLALAAAGVGRRRPESKFLVHFAIVGVFACALEILYYQISTYAYADKLIAIAALCAGITYAYQVFAPWLIGWWRLSELELKIWTHIHWGLGSWLLFPSIFNPNSIQYWLSLSTGVFLSNYAIWQGRRPPETNTTPIQEIWVYFGLLEAGSIGLYIMSKLPPGVVAALWQWGGLLGAVIACFLHFLPWENWGWPARPWQVAAKVLPAAVVLLSAQEIHPGGLLGVAGFYIALARINGEIRLTYLSVATIDWLLWRWFQEMQFWHPLWYVAPLAMSLLYIAQIDPALTPPQGKDIRHLLRLFATGGLCFTSLFTAHWLVTGGISAATMMVGLWLRVRAFLYVGTLVFLLNVFYEMVILAVRDALLKWIVGLIAGVSFIWIAATFESRRQEVVAFVQNWLAELESWE
ncbi:MAG TPA: DUF2157 domain-containing protein [Oscillatoriaceae cyanobacterium M33_DOE_052]|uniref:DUF2157 domain-containing protein n=1 Tax=Planktothricoides sp. SpSt-374 TaxID=2282167 RepID=A0A7C3VV49_9CYAN|nr:DUF2157 domain-containing protein [Oscillatoriaceae cyanobacterium M33_DOE_052]